MNQAQRKYLIDEVSKKAKAKIAILEKQLPPYPNLNNYLIHEIMSDRFQLKPLDEIRASIIRDVLALGKRDSYVSENWNVVEKDTVKIKVFDLFEMPATYYKLLEEYKLKSHKIKEEVSDINKTLNSLVLRINLASNKRLEKIISEVDDMGDLSLFDDKLKLLN